MPAADSLSSGIIIIPVRTMQSLLSLNRNEFHLSTFNTSTTTYTLRTATFFQFHAFSWFSKTAIEYYRMGRKNVIYP